MSPTLSRALTVLVTLATGAVAAGDALPRWVQAVAAGVLAAAAALGLPGTSRVQARDRHASTPVDGPSRILDGWPRQGSLTDDRVKDP